MSVNVNIFYPHLQQFTNNQDIVKVNGNTVGECLDHLVKQFPGIEKGIFDEHGQLLNFIYFLINGKGAYPTNLAQPLKDGDEITVVLLLAGG
jgi:molybdopterin converting factor small subunit